MLFWGIVIGFILGIVSIKFYYYNNKDVSGTREKLAVKLIEGATDMIYYCEIKPKFKYIYMNPSMENFLSSNLTHNIYNNPNIFFEKIHPDDLDKQNKKFQGIIDFKEPIIQRLKNKNGDYIWVEEYASPIYEKNEIVAIQGIVRNVNEKMKVTKALEYKIYHDVATGIYSREFFQNNIEKYDKLIDVPIGIILCDLDELKYTNDNFGHKKGDALIKECTNILNKFSRKNVIVSRIGGDEFAILIINTNEKFVSNTVVLISQEIEKYNKQSKDMNIKMSKGYAFSSTSIDAMSGLFITADRNMYADKTSRKKGRNNYSNDFVLSH